MMEGLDPVAAKMNDPRPMFSSDTRRGIGQRRKDEERAEDESKMTHA
jgi:hypothetical protein